MAKKNFRNEFNPALQFISAPEPAEKPAAKKADEKREINNSDEPVKRSPLYIETKSKRLQLLMQPSLFNKLKEIAGHRETSVNDLIHTVLDEYTEENK